MMMALHRIVELQARSISRQTTDTPQEYDYIESLIESLKPPIPQTKHHYLIRTPFRYPLPVPSDYQARFKPPFYPRNPFYGAAGYETCVFETAYHWLRQRVHLKGLSQRAEPRTYFTVSFHDERLVDISRRKDVKALMDRRDYAASHRFIETHPETTSILYPSCRDPQRRPCVVTFQIESLGKKPRNLTTVEFIYDERLKRCKVLHPLYEERPMEVDWKDVA
jgi:hypothetical protein